MFLCPTVFSPWTNTIPYLARSSSELGGQYDHKQNDLYQPRTMKKKKKKKKKLLASVRPNARSYTFEAPKTRCMLHGTVSFAKYLDDTISDDLFAAPVPPPNPPLRPH